MAFSAPTMARLLLNGVLYAPPTAATASGYYTQLFGIPSVGLLGDIIYFNQSNLAATIALPYAYAGSSFATASGDSYEKYAGTWVPEKISVAAILSAAPTGSTPAGFYTQTAGAVSGYALGDIFYWSGSSAYPYLSYAKAPVTIDVAGESYHKHAGSWYIDINPVTISEALTVTAVAGASQTPVNPTFLAVNRSIIEVVDNGDGWPELSLMFDKAAGGDKGFGDYLVKLPGGLKFDLTFHSVYATVGDPGMSGHMAWIPGSHGLISNYAVRMSCYATVWDATHFRIHSGGEGLYSGFSGVRSPWSSSVFIASDPVSIQHSYRFKKG